MLSGSAAFFASSGGLSEDASKGGLVVDSVASNSFSPPVVDVVSHAHGAADLGVNPFGDAGYDGAAVPLDADVKPHFPRVTAAAMLAIPPSSVAPLHKLPTDKLQAIDLPCTGAGSAASFEGQTEASHSAVPLGTQQFHGHRTACFVPPNPAVGRHRGLLWSVGASHAAASQAAGLIAAKSGASGLGDGASSTGGAEGGGATSHITVEVRDAASAALLESADRLKPHCVPMALAFVPCPVPHVAVEENKSGDATKGEPLCDGLVWVGFNDGSVRLFPPEMNKAIIGATRPPARTQPAVIAELAKVHASRVSAFCVSPHLEAASTAMSDPLLVRQAALRAASTSAATSVAASNPTKGFQMAMQDPNALVDVAYADDASTALPTGGEDSAFGPVKFVGDTASEMASYIVAVASADGVVSLYDARAVHAAYAQAVAARQRGSSEQTVSQRPVNVTQHACNAPLQAAQLRVHAGASVDPSAPQSQALGVCGAINDPEAGEGGNATVVTKAPPASLAEGLDRRFSYVLPLGAATAKPVLRLKGGVAAVRSMHWAHSAVVDPAPQGFAMPVSTNERCAADPPMPKFLIKASHDRFNTVRARRFLSGEPLPTDAQPASPTAKAAARQRQKPLCLAPVPSARTVDVLVTGDEEGRVAFWDLQSELAEGLRAAGGAAGRQARQTRAGTPPLAPQAPTSGPLAMFTLGRPNGEDGIPTAAKTRVDDILASPTSKGGRAGSRAEAEELAAQPLSRGQASVVGVCASSPVRIPFANDSDQNASRLPTVLDAARRDLILHMFRAMRVVVVLADGTLQSVSCVSSEEEVIVPPTNEFAGSDRRSPMPPRGRSMSLPRANDLLEDIAHSAARAYTPPAAPRSGSAMPDDGEFSFLRGRHSRRTSVDGSVGNPPELAVFTSPFGDSSDTTGISSIGFEQRALETRHGAIANVFFDRRRRQLWVAGVAGILDIWDIDSAKLSSTLPHPASAHALHPHDQRLLEFIQAVVPSEEGVPRLMGPKLSSLPTGLEERTYGRYTVLLAPGSASGARIKPASPEALVDGSTSVERDAARAREARRNLSAAVAATDGERTTSIVSCSAAPRSQDAPIADREALSAQRIATAKRKWDDLSTSVAVAERSARGVAHRMSVLLDKMLHAADLGAADAQALAVMKSWAAWAADRRHLRREGADFEVQERLAMDADELREQHNAAAAAHRVHRDTKRQAAAAMLARQNAVRQGLRMINAWRRAVALKAMRRRVKEQQFKLGVHAIRVRYFGAWCTGILLKNAAREQHAMEQAATRMAANMADTAQARALAHSLASYGQQQKAAIAAHQRAARTLLPFLERRARDRVRRTFFAPWRERAQKAIEERKEKAVAEQLAAADARRKADAARDAAALREEVAAEADRHAVAAAEIADCEEAVLNTRATHRQEAREAAVEGLLPAGAGSGPEVNDAPVDGPALGDEALRRIGDATAPLPVYEEATAELLDVVGLTRRTAAEMEGKLAAQAAEAAALEALIKQEQGETPFDEARDNLVGPAFAPFVDTAAATSILAPAAALRSAGEVADDGACGVAAPTPDVVAGLMSDNASVGNAEADVLNAVKQFADAVGKATIDSVEEQHRKEVKADQRRFRRRELDGAPDSDDSVGLEGDASDSMMMRGKAAGGLKALRDAQDHQAAMTQWLNNNFSALDDAERKARGEIAGIEAIRFAGLQHAAAGGRTTMKFAKAAILTRALVEEAESAAFAAIGAAWRGNLDAMAAALLRQAAMSLAALEAQQRSEFGMKIATPFSAGLDAAVAASERELGRRSDEATAAAARAARLKAAKARAKAATKAFEAALPQLDRDVENAVDRLTDAKAALRAAQNALTAAQNGAADAVAACQTVDQRAQAAKDLEHAEKLWREAVADRSAVEKSITAQLYAKSGMARADDSEADVNDDGADRPEQNGERLAPNKGPSPKTSTPQEHSDARRVVSLAARKAEAARVAKCEADVSIAAEHEVVAQKEHEAAAAQKRALDAVVASHEEALAKAEATRRTAKKALDAAREEVNRAEDEVIGLEAAARESTENATLHKFRQESRHVSTVARAVSPSRGVSVAQSEANSGPRLAHRAMLGDRRKSQGGAHRQVDAHPRAGASLTVTEQLAAARKAVGQAYAIEETAESKFAAAEDVLAAAAEAHAAAVREAEVATQRYLKAKAIFEAAVEELKRARTALDAAIFATVPPSAQPVDVVTAARRFRLARRYATAVGASPLDADLVVPEREKRAAADRLDAAKKQVVDAEAELAAAKMVMTDANTARRDAERQWDRDCAEARQLAGEGPGDASRSVGDASRFPGDRDKGPGDETARRHDRLRRASKAAADELSDLNAGRVSGLAALAGAWKAALQGSLEAETSARGALLAAARAAQTLAAAETLGRAARLPPGDLKSLLASLKDLFGNPVDPDALADAIKAFDDPKGKPMHHRYPVTITAPPERPRGIDLVALPRGKGPRPLGDGVDSDGFFRTRFTLACIPGGMRLGDKFVSYPLNPAPETASMEIANAPVSLGKTSEERSGKAAIFANAANDLALAFDRYEASVAATTYAALSETSTRSHVNFAAFAKRTAGFKERVEFRALAANATVLQRVADEVAEVRFSEARI